MKYRIVPLTAIALILLGCFTSATFAQGHTIRGKLETRWVRMLAESLITLERNGALIDQTVSNNEGDFTFTTLTDTSYTVVVSAPDYNPTSESVEFVRATGSDQPGETRTVEITLIAKGGVRPRAQVSPSCRMSRSPRAPLLNPESRLLVRIAFLKQCPLTRARWGFFPIILMRTLSWPTS